MEVKIARAIFGVPIILIGVIMLNGIVHDEPIRTLIYRVIGGGLILLGMYVGFYNRDTYRENARVSKTQTKLIQSAHRALHAAVPTSTKAIYAKIVGDTLIWRVYFDTEPTEDEIERLSEAQTEIIADFSKIQSVNENYIVHPAPINYSTKHYSEWIFTRLEEQQKN